MSRPKALIDSSVCIEFFGRGKCIEFVERVLAEYRITGIPSLVFFEVCRRVAKLQSSEAA